MSIVSQNRPTGQFRCRLIAGVRWYEQIIPTADGANNYQEASRRVVEAAWAEFYRKPETGECVKLTDASKTSTESLSVSFGGSLKQTALSTCAITTNMASASAHLTSFSAISGK